MDCRQQKRATQQGARQTARDVKRNDSLLRRVPLLSLMRTGEDRAGQPVCALYRPALQRRAMAWLQQSVGQRQRSRPTACPTWILGMQDMLPSFK
jgi:hypothetical protein